MKNLHRAPLATAARLAALLVLLSPAMLFGQPGTSALSAGSRWWAGAGTGYLAGRADCSNCESAPPYDDGMGFVIQGGLHATDRLQLGAEVFSSSRAMPSGDFRETQLLGIVQFRPFARAGFFLKGGYGMAFAKGVFPLAHGGEDTYRTWGMGVMYGAGWVFGQRRRVSFAPVAATYIMTVGDIQAPAGTASNVVVNGWFVGAVAMFR